jgi:putative peptidoglycan lipid II flippase
VAYVLYANLLAAVVLVTLAEPIVRLLFEYGRFDRNSTLEVSRALACLGPGLIAFSVANLKARAFFALGDTATPMRISVFTLALNVLVTGLLLPRFHAAGLALANSLTSCLNAALLAYALRRKLGRLDLAGLRRQVGVLASAALLAGLVAATTTALWQRHLGHHTVVLRLGEVFAPMAAAGLLYFLVTLRAGIPTARELIDLARGKPVAPTQAESPPADNP